MKTANRCFENAGKLKYFGQTVTEQSFDHGKIKSRLDSSNASYHSIQNLLSPRLLCRNVSIKKKV
jgi:hypothetical protein